MTPQPDARLVVTTHPNRRDHLAGAWWPYSTAAEVELGLLLPRAAEKFGPVLGVSLNRDEWPDAPLICRLSGLKAPKITWYGLAEAHLAVLHRRGQNPIALLVVPPDTPEDIALTAILLAATPGNSMNTSQILARAAEPLAG